MSTTVEFVDRRDANCKTRYRGAVFTAASRRYAAVKSVSSLCYQKWIDSQCCECRSALSEFQTLQAATLSTRLAVSVRVLGTNRRTARSISGLYSDRVVSWHCNSSSRYGRTDVDRAFDDKNVAYCVLRINACIRAVRQRHEMSCADRSRSDGFWGDIREEKSSRR